MYLGKLLTSITIAAFLLVGVGSITHAGMMESDCQADSVCCSLMGHDAAVCSMNPLEHLSAWQSLFAAIPAQSTVMLLLLLVALLLVFRLNQCPWLLYASSQPVYIRRDPGVIIHDSLRRFITRGLMHPKIF